MHPENVGKKISRVGTAAVIGTASVLAPGCIPSKESFPSSTPIVETTNQGMPSLNTPTPKPTETATPVLPTPTATERPLSTATPTPTELPKTPTKVPIPEDNISKETAQFVEWSPQKVDQTLHEAWEKGEFKTVINWDVNREGWELKKIKAPWIKQGPPETLALFLPEGEVFDFLSPLTERVYGANIGKEEGGITLRKDNDHIGISYGFSPTAELFFKGGPNLEINPTPKVGESIFRLRFVANSKEQKIFEGPYAEGVAVVTAFIDPVAKKYVGIRIEHFLTDEKGRLVVLNPNLGAK